MKVIDRIKYLIYFAPTLLLAQGTPPGGSGQIPNPLAGANTLTALLKLILNNIVMPIAAIVVVIYIIWAGFSYVTARGNSKKIEEAHQRLLWALIGAGILLGAAGISSVIQTTVCGVIATTPCP